MTKKDFHGIIIDEKTIFLSKNKKINMAVSKLFYKIKSNKIEKIIQAVMSYDDEGLRSACLKKGTLTLNDIKNNNEFFCMDINMLAQYISTTEKCSKDVLNAINKCIDDENNKNISGVVNE